MSLPMQTPCGGNAPRHLLQREGMAVRWAQLSLKYQEDCLLVQGQLSRRTQS